MEDNSVAAGAAPLKAGHTPTPWRLVQEPERPWRVRIMEGDTVILIIDRMF